MIGDWWMAHRLEVLVDVVVIALLVMIAAVCTIVWAVRARRKMRRDIDEAWLEMNGLRRCPRCRSFDVFERAEFGGNSRTRHTIMCHVCKVESDVTGAR